MYYLRRKKADGTGYEYYRPTADGKGEEIWGGEDPYWVYEQSSVWDGFPTFIGGAGVGVLVVLIGLVILLLIR